MPTKGARGEMFLEQEGESHAVLFTLRALAEAEQRTGHGILAMLRGASFTINDIAAILLSGLEAGRRDGHTGARPYTMKRAMAMIEDLGYLTVAGEVISALSEVLDRDSDAEDADKTKADDDGRPPQ